MYSVNGSRKSFHGYVMFLFCFFSGCYKTLRKLNHEEFTLKYRPEFALIACKPRQEKNVKTFDRTFGEGEGEDQKRSRHCIVGLSQEASS